MIAGGPGGDPHDSTWCDIGRVGCLTRALVGRAVRIVLWVYVSDCDKVLMCISSRDAQLTRDVVEDRVPGCQPRPPQLSDVMQVHGAEIKRLAGYYSRDPMDASDLEQEILVALWRALPSFRGRSTVRTFVLRVARNRCISHRLRTSRVLRKEVALGDDEVGSPCVGIEPDPLMEAAHRQRVRRLYRGVSALPPSLRDVVVLSLSGASQREVGHRLGITEGAVAVRLFRARQNLRAMLDRRHFFDPAG